MPRSYEWLVYDIGLEKNMSEEQSEKGQEVYPPIQAGPLPIWPIMRDAVLIPWDNRGQIFGLMVIPISMSTILDNLEEKIFLSGFVGVLFWIGIWSLVSANFAVHCHRLILLPSKPAPLGGLGGWTKREGLFYRWFLIGILAGVSGITGIFLALDGVLKFAGIFQEADAFFDKYPMLSIYFCFFPFSYFFGRACIIFPTIAIDEKPSIKKSWVVTRRNGWRVAILIWIVPYTIYFSWSFIIGDLSQQFFNEGGILFLQVLENLLYFSAYSIEIAILSLCFKELSWWNGPRLEKRLIES